MMINLIRADVNPSTQEKMHCTCPALPKMVACSLFYTFKLVPLPHRSPDQHDQLRIGKLPATDTQRLIKHFIIYKFLRTNSSANLWSGSSRPLSTLPIYFSLYSGTTDLFSVIRFASPTRVHDRGAKIHDS